MIFLRHLISITVNVQYSATLNSITVAVKTSFWHKHRTSLEKIHSLDLKLDKIYPLAVSLINRRCFYFEQWLTDKK